MSPADWTFFLAAFSSSDSSSEEDAELSSSEFLAAFLGALAASTLAIASRLSLLAFYLLVSAV